MKSMCELCVSQPTQNSTMYLLSSLGVGQLYSLVWVDCVMLLWPPLQTFGLSLFTFLLLEIKSCS